MTRADDAKLGFFFTDSPETAAGYANNALPQDLIAARDEYEALQEKWGESDDPKVAKEYHVAEKKYERMMEEYRKSGGSRTVMEAYLSMKNPLVIDMKGAAYQGNSERYRKAIEQAKAQGCDGVIFKNVYDSVGGEKYRKKGDVYVVFTPEQVKSVGNIGTFDKTNPNVRYSVNTGGNVEDGGNISVANKNSRRYNEEEIDKILSDTKNAIKNHPLRRAYEEEVKELGKYEAKMRAQNKTDEIIAKILYQMRRNLGIKYKDLTPEGLRDFIYEMNIERYGDPLGPSFETLVERYGGNKGRPMDEIYKKIIAAAQRPNADIDSLLKKYRDWLLNK